MTTTEQKLIANLKELIEFYEKKLSTGEINSAWNFKVGIDYLEQELAEQKPIEDRSHLIQINDGMDDDIEVNGLVDPSMIKCFTIGQKPENLRDELIKFAEWEGEKEYAIHVPLECIIDDYLQQKGE